jgi:5-methylcytosine-specific restriction endonuclease McrA
LNEFYRKRDDEQVTYREFKMQRIFFSIKFLSSCKKIHGSLKCVYCNKKDLWICDNLKHKFTEEDYKTLATTDHFIPISKGGDIFDKDNCVVACHECNQKKKDKIGYIDKNGNYKF